MNTHHDNPPPANPLRPVRITVEQQGELLRVQHHSGRPTDDPGNVPKRGNVSRFSAKSRKRMMDMLARLDRQAIHQTRFKPRFITLTYPITYPDAKAAKTHLDTFLKRLERRWDIATVWRLEFQERGAPHFHLLMFNLPYVSIKWLQRQWSQVTETDANNSLDHEVVRSLNGVMFYAAKYMTKPDDDDDPAPELSLTWGDQITLETPPDAAACPLGLSVCHNSPGRFWGVRGRRFMPFAERLIYTVTVCAAALHAACAALDHPWASHQHGFTVFASNADALQRILAGELGAWGFGNDVAADVIASGWAWHGARERSFAAFRLGVYSRVDFTLFPPQTDSAEPGDDKPLLDLSGWVFDPDPMPWMRSW